MSLPFLQTLKTAMSQIQSKKSNIRCDFIKGNNKKFSGNILIQNNEKEHQLLSTYPKFESACEAVCKMWTLKHELKNSNLNKLSDENLKKAFAHYDIVCLNE